MFLILTTNHEGRTSYMPKKSTRDKSTSLKRTGKTSLRESTDLLNLSRISTAGRRTKRKRR